jgi:hypothetical protein
MSAGRRNRQRGVAVLMAVLVVAVGTVIAVNIMWEATLNIRRTESALAADQGLLYLQGAEAWAADILAQDLADSQEYDHIWLNLGQQCPQRQQGIAHNRCVNVDVFAHFGRINVYMDDLGLGGKGIKRARQTVIKPSADGK